MYIMYSILIFMQIFLYFYFLFYKNMNNQVDYFAYYKVRTTLCVKMCKKQAGMVAIYL